MVVQPQQQPASDDPTQTAAAVLLRHMDLLMYVMYSRDELFVRDMVRKVTNEVCDKFACEELRALLEQDDRPGMYRGLFFLMLNFHKEFRHWALTAPVGLRPVCPHKATRFLVQLKDELVPAFLVDERMCMQDFERQLKVAYIAS